MNYRYFIFVFLFILYTPFAYAQYEDEELNNNSDVVEFAQNVIKILESTEAINQLILNRKTVDGQLADINTWAMENKINPATYETLKISYERYSDHMNNVFNNLSSEIRSIKRFRRIKKIRLDRIISDYSEVYSTDLQRANNIYNDSFLPAYELASKEAESKGFFSGIILIIKFGEALFTTLSDLITNGKIGRKAEAKIIAYGAEVAISELKKKMYYKPWESIVLNRGDGSQAMQGLTTRLSYPEETSIKPAPYYRAVDGSISLSFYQSDISIPVALSSKEITAANDNSKIQAIPEFATAATLQNGDKFWVKISGYEYVEFFYFSDQSGYWKSPFGKEIVVRNDTEQKNGSTLYLPSKSSFFEISGTNAYEEFLILVSNSSIDEGRNNAIIGSEERGTLFLETLQKILGNVKQPWEFNSQSMPSGNIQAIPLQQSGKEQTYIPIYIRINKN